MPLPAELYLEAAPDLMFRDQPHRVGTCPACGEFGMSLKLLLWPGRPPEYEPFCPAGCTTEAINEAVWNLTEGQEQEAQAA